MHGSRTNRRARGWGSALLVGGLVLTGGTPSLLAGGPTPDGPPAPIAPPPAAPAPAPTPVPVPVPVPVPAAAPPAAPLAPNAVPPAGHGEFSTEGRIDKPDGTSVYFYRTNFAKAGELIAALTTLVTIPGATYKEFPRQNQILIMGTPEVIETALDAIAYFDIPDPQVYVEAKIVEMTYDNNFEFGFSGLWDRDQVGPNTIFRGGSVTLNPPSFFQSQLPGSQPFQGAGISFGFVGKTAQEFGLMDLTLQALQRDGTAEVLSKPSIVATEGVKAEVHTGQKTPVVTIQNAASAPAGETLLVNTTYIETKIGLEVMAVHIGDQFVKLDVFPTVSGVAGYSVGVNGTSAPIILDRTAHTVVTMGDGDTLIIGGLYTNATVKDNAKFPFLGDIPCIGKLFTRTKDSKVKTELVFFITPHILRKKSDYTVITPPAEKLRLGEEPTEPGCKK